MTSNDPREQALDCKTALRKVLLAQRSRITRREKSIADQSLKINLRAFLEARACASVSVYVSTAEEVETRGLIDTLVAAGVCVAVPKLISRTEMIAVEFPGWAEMEPGSLGIPSPRATSPVATRLDAAVVPGLGFSETGARLGFGAGYYDRWLAARPQTLKIGVAFDFQILDYIPFEAHDVAMDILVTPTRTIDLRPEAG